MRFLLEELTVIFNFYGGRDFDEEATTLTSASSTSSIPGVTEASGHNIPVNSLNKTSSASSLLEKEIDSLSQKTCVSYKHGSSPSGKEGLDLRVRFDDEPQNNLWTSLNLVSGSFDNNSPKTRGIPSPKSLTGTASGYSSGYLKTLGGKYRDRDTCVLISLSKVKTLFETYEQTHNVSWRFILMIHEIEVLDKVRISDINKILYEYTSDSMPKRNSANMFSVRAVSKKNPDDNNDEADIKVSAKPLKVNIDQDTLMFLIEFFTSIASSASPASSQATTNLPQSSLNASSNAYVSNSAAISPKCSQKQGDQKDMADGLPKGKFLEREEDHSPIPEEDGEEDNEGDESENDEYNDCDITSNLVERGSRCRSEIGSSEKLRRDKSSSSSPITKRRDSVSSNKSIVSQTSSKPPSIYVKSFRFSPDVPIRLDYTGKRVNLDQVSPFVFRILLALLAECALAVEFLIE
jgi:hypothetical protein